MARWSNGRRNAYRCKKYHHMCGSCHFNRTSKDEFSIKFSMFVLNFFSVYTKIRSERSPIHSKLSLLSLKVPQISKLGHNEKHNYIKYSKFNTDVLSKWHYLDIKPKKHLAKKDWKYFYIYTQSSI